MHAISIRDNCFIVITIAAILSGCQTAQMVSANRSNSPYAPVNEASHGGEVKYSEDGRAERVRQQREAAYEKMYSYCGGKYKIVSEWTDASQMAAVPMWGGVYSTAMKERHIKFECLQRN